MRRYSGEKWCKFPPVVCEVGVLGGTAMQNGEENCLLLAVVSELGGTDRGCRQKYLSVLVNGKNIGGTKREKYRRNLSILSGF